MWPRTRKLTQFMQTSAFTHWQDWTWQWTVFWFYWNPCLWLRIDWAQVTRGQFVLQQLHSAFIMSKENHWLTDCCCCFCQFNVKKLFRPPAAAFKSQESWTLFHSARVCFLAVSTTNSQRRCWHSGFWAVVLTPTSSAFAVPPPWPAAAPVGVIPP